MDNSEPETDGFRSELRTALGRHFEDDTLQLETFSRRGEGYSWETYIVGVRRRGSNGSAQLERFAVKREPSAGLLAPYDVQLEVDLLETAGKDIGCPVPRVVTFEVGSENSKGFYVMEMVDGVVPMPWDVKKVVPDDAVRRALGLEIAVLMAKLHSKDVSELRIHGMSPPADPRSTGSAEVGKWQAIYVECSTIRLPVLDLAFAWLSHRSDWVSGRVSLVHNDLRVGNVIVKDGRVAAVLDWETAEFTDPAADLAKFNLQTFRGRSTLASGLVDWEEFLDVYQEKSGWRPDEGSLIYWSVLEIVKAIVGALRAEYFFTSGRTDDIRYANMGFQTHHSIKWLIELFETGKWGH